MLSDKYLAANCMIYGLPCSEPCRLCHFLYHKATECRNFQLDGKPKVTKLEACQDVNQVDTEAFNYENFQDQDF